MAGALHVLMLAKPILSTSATTPSSCWRAHEILPNTACPAIVLVLSVRALPEPRGASRNSGRKRVVWSRKRPSNACGSVTCAGALCVSASRCKRRGRASGDDDRSRESGALVVCAETRKLLRKALDDEREMFACRALWGEMCQHAAHGRGCCC